jgi:diguanylate cyclase (GGDEF)-like protein
VLFLDLDGFKHINDSLGHPTGDKLLQSIAKRLVDCVRGSDTVSRQGGDEFVVLLTEVGLSEDAAITARSHPPLPEALHRS